MSEILLLQKDCEQFLIDLPEPYHLCVTSPPYGRLRKYKGYEWGWEKFVRLASLLYQKAEDGAVVVWVVGDETKNGSESGDSFRQALHFKDVGFNLHDTMIYKKESPPLTHNRYEQKFEYMFVLAKGKPRHFNGLRAPAIYARSSRKSCTMRQDSDDLGNRSARGVVQSTKLKGNVWEYGVGFNKSATDKLAHRHPAIFPEQLASDHIISWSNQGDLVIDPFLGSGTTAKMASHHGRRFMGCDVSDEYLGIAKARIEAARQGDEHSGATTDKGE